MAGGELFRPLGRFGNDAVIRAGIAALAGAMGPYWAAGAGFGERMQGTFLSRANRRVDALPRKWPKRAWLYASAHFARQTKLSAVPRSVFQSEASIGFGGEYVLPATQRAAAVIARALVNPTHGSRP